MMYRIFGLTAALLLILSLSSCKPRLEEVVSTYPAATTTVTDESTIAPLEAKVELIGQNGASLPYFSAILWSFDGMMAADGELMFLSVSEFLPGYADQIPLVEPGETPEIRATAREGVEINNPQAVDVYDEDFALLAERVPLSELSARGKAQWPGKTVYLYFDVTFRLTENGKYLRGSSSGYFVKTTFAQ